MLAVVLIFASIIPLSAAAREFPQGSIIEIRECGVALFVVVITPDGLIFASPVWREPDGSFRLDNEETGKAIMDTIGQAATTKGSMARFHIDRFKDRPCVEANRGGGPA